MTDPTPTRAEVEALSIAGYRHGYPRSYGTCWEYLDPSRKDLSELEWEPLVTKSQADATIAALRERAEAAERDRSRLIIANGQLIDDAVSMGMARDAAWNDAIEAAAVAAEEWDTFGPTVRAIRALRRAAPTEGEA